MSFPPGFRLVGKSLAERRQAWVGFAAQPHAARCSRYVERWWRPRFPVWWEGRDDGLYSDYEVTVPLDLSDD